MTILVSVVMIDGQFRESFHAVDAFCTQSLPHESYELIWVEFFDQVKPELEEKIATYPNARIVMLGHKEEIYHSSYCFNAGIGESRGEIVFIPDADVVVEPGFLEQALEEHSTNDKLVLYFYRRDEPKEMHTEDVQLERLQRVCQLSNTANYGGCISVRKSWLLAINGYEQHPVFGSGQHANGLDVYTRLKNLGLHVMWHPRLMLYHPWHPMTANPLGVPTYKVQKVMINHRARSLSTRANQGLDPANDVDLSAALSDELAAAIRKHDLHRVFDTWNNLRLDPVGQDERLFFRLFTRSRTALWRWARRLSRKLS